MLTHPDGKRSNYDDNGDSTSYVKSSTCVFNLDTWTNWSKNQRASCLRTFYLAIKFLPTLHYFSLKRFDVWAKSCQTTLSPLLRL